MQFRKLGDTGIDVSALCLGTMTWGQQNTEAEAHQQLDLAMEAGANFIDTAEMYPPPGSAETQGRTEEILGNWLARTEQRQHLIIASKVTGSGEWVGYIRHGTGYRTRRNIEDALDGSLRRLRTDYLDLYQTHWPDRETNIFGRMNYVHTPDKDGARIEDTLGVLADLVKAGKIRHIGVCNETPWGLSQWLRAADSPGLPAVVSIQNPFNLLNRTFELGLSEFAHRENIALLAYSPLAFGMLTGKYADGAVPAGTRLTQWASHFRRYSTDAGRSATTAYVALARANGLEPATMALAWVLSRPFTTGVIIGATSTAQLKMNLASASVQLPQDLLREIDKIHALYPNPCP